MLTILLEPMEAQQESLKQAVIEKAKKLDLSCSFTDPPFSDQEWKILIPFITNNPNLRELRLNCKCIDIKSNNLYRL